MSDPHPILHDKALTPAKRVAQAFAWIRQPEACQVPDQGPVAAKVFLLYRAIDGLLTDEEEAEAVQAQVPAVVHRGLAARWAMSLGVAEAYLALSRGRWTEGMAKASAVRGVWAAGAKNAWPPQVLNDLRMTLIVAYFHYLHGETALLRANLAEAMADWKEHVQGWDMARWPYRPKEAHDDLICLQALAFIARAAGLAEFGDVEWAQQESAISYFGASTSPLYPILRRMGPCLNPTKALWWPRPAGRLVGEYAKLHAKQAYGQGGMSEATRQRLWQLAGADPSSVIDFGCGRSRDAVTLWPGARHFLYDPAIPELKAFPSQRFELGLCTEVLEHIPLEEIDNLLWEMRCLSDRWLCTVHTAAAAQVLPNGENAHCLQRPAEWWRARFARIFGREPRTEPINHYRFILSL
jgi:hypothetical protein